MVLYQVRDNGIFMFRIGRAVRVTDDLLDDLA
jgi:hypothetical protein